MAFDLSSVPMEEVGVVDPPASYDVCTFERDLLNGGSTAAGLPMAELPLYYEVWNWEGDTTVLPGKWFRVVKKCFGAKFCDQKGIGSGAYLSEKYGVDHGGNKSFDPKSFFFVTLRSEVVATCFGWKEAIDGGGTTGVLHWLAVDPGHRKLGIGTALITLVCSRLKEQGFQNCRLRTESFREGAIRLYLANGFLLIGKEKAGGE